VGFQYNTFGNDLTEYNSSGALIGTVSNVETPRGIAFDSTGNIYVASQNGQVIYKFNPDGTGETVWASSLVVNPRGIAFNSSGDLFVADNDPDNQVIEISPNGATSTVFTTAVNGPNDLVFDPLGDLYVASFYSSEVDEFTPNGTDIGPIITGLNKPGGLVAIFNGTAVPEPPSFGLVGMVLVIGIVVSRWFTTLSFRELKQRF
jgi:DNA-binding beta-propeller fold protein YncE